MIRVPVAPIRSLSLSQLPDNHLFLSIPPPFDDIGSRLGSTRWIDWGEAEGLAGVLGRAGGDSIGW